MFDIVRRRLPWVVAAVMALTLTGQAALAQTDEEFIPSAGINADRVDGKHAITSTGKKNKRKGKLMAFAASGYLPNNVIQKALDADKLDGLDSTAFATIAALQSSAGAVNEADNPVHWNQIQGVPPKVLAGDTTRSFIGAESAALANDAAVFLFVDQPVGLDVETTLIPTTAGQTVYLVPSPITGGAEGFQRLDVNTIRHWVYLKNYNVTSTVKVRVTVWNDSYISLSAAKNKVKATFVSPKKAREMLGIK